MADGKNNQARNLDDDSSRVGEGWDLPEDSLGEKGADKFLYVDDAAPDIQKEVRELADRAQKSVDVTAEDSLENGFEIFSTIASREKLEVPSTVAIIGGMDSVRDVSMAVENGNIVDAEGRDQHRLNIHCSADAGDHSYNQDGVAIYYDNFFDRLNILLAHGPQFDPLAINLANAAAVRASLELINNPKVSPQRLVDRVQQNVAEVADEMGESGKEVQLTSLQLNQTGDQNNFTLDILNPGNNHCILVNTENGEVSVFDSADEVASRKVKTGDIVILASDELVKALKTARKESQDLYLGNTFFIEAQTGTSLKEISDGIIKSARDNGLDCGVGLTAVRIPEGIDTSF